jgi:hypothetical protein
MSRRAFVLPVVLLTSGAIGLLAATIVVGATQRAQQARQHQARVQAREWCLGARLLPPRSVVTVDGWSLAVDADGAASAGDVRGTWRIAADGAESWERRR